MENSHQKQQKPSSSDTLLLEEKGGLALEAMQRKTSRLVLSHEPPVQLANRKGFIESTLSDQNVYDVDYATDSETTNSGDILPLLLMCLMHTTSVLLRSFSGESQESIKESLLKKSATAEMCQLPGSTIETVHPQSGTMELQALHKNKSDAVLQPEMARAKAKS